MSTHEEYLRRNLIHAGAVGVHANMQHIAERLRATKKPPKWLLLELERTAPRAEAAHMELAKWRNTAPDRPEYIEPHDSALTSTER